MSLHPKPLLFFSVLSALTLEKSSRPTNFTSCLRENPYYAYTHKKAESELAVYKAVYFTSSDHRRQGRHLSEPLSLQSSDKQVLCGLTVGETAWRTDSYGNETPAKGFNLLSALERKSISIIRYSVAQAS